jgi:hypothetical protein
MREYHYRVDGDGRIFHDGSEIVDPATLRFFVLAMQRQPDGRHLVMCQGERNWFDAADTPIVIQRLRLHLEASALARVELELPGGHWEPLDPASLSTERGHLYAGVRRGQLRARLGRVAMQQLAPHLVPDGGGAALALGNTRHPIAEPTPVTA